MAASFAQTERSPPAHRRQISLSSNERINRVTRPVSCYNNSYTILNQAVGVSIKWEIFVKVVFGTNRARMCVARSDPKDNI